MAKCKGKTKAGKRCRMNAIKGGSYCIAHDSKKKKEQKAGRVKGGKARKARTLPPVTEAPSLRTPEEALALLEETVHQLRTGQLDRGIANAIVGALNVGFRYIDHMARVAGKIRDGEAMALLTHPEWIQIKSALMEALKPYPEARTSVASKLKELPSAEN